MVRAFQWDLARQVEPVGVLIDLLARHADWGYQRLYLHLEDAVDYPSLPGVARADAWTWGDLERLVAAARARGIEVVPIANLLGHTQYLIKHPRWRAANELVDPATGEPLATGQVCPLHPLTLEAAERLFADLAPLCTAGEIHAGLDESFHLGKHPRSRAEIADVGLAGHFARHVGRLHGLATARGLRLGLWGDMLALLPEATALLPRGPAPAVYDWYYHPFGARPRMELYGFYDYELAPALKQAGAAYWACPMNGAFRHEVAPVWGDRLQNLAAWWRRARAVGADGYLVTSWEPYRLALPATTLVNAAAATLWLEPAAGDDPAALLAAGLRRAHGVGRGEAGRLARALLATDERAFAGNSRWEANVRWDTVGPRRDGAAAPARAERRLARLAAATEKREPAELAGWLAPTLRFQAYLEARDVFVRKAAAAVERLRRLAARGGAEARRAEVCARAQEEALEFAARLAEARRSARAMWVASRPAASFAASQNAGVLRADAARLRAWRAWLRAVGRRAGQARRPSVMAGRWTLRFTVAVETPAWQKVVVEQLGPDGAWREIYGRVLIEFRGYAARPRPKGLRFEFACPVAGPEARLRIASRCVGAFAVARAELSDGVTTLRTAEPRTWRGLGEPPATSGWPKVDWVTNTGTWEPEWVVSGQSF